MATRITWQIRPFVSLLLFFKSFRLQSIFLLPVMMDIFQMKPKSLYIYFPALLKQTFVKRYPFVPEAWKHNLSIITRVFYIMVVGEHQAKITKSLISLTFAWMGMTHTCQLLFNFEKNLHPSTSLRTLERGTSRGRCSSSLELSALHDLGTELWGQILTRNYTKN